MEPADSQPAQSPDSIAVSEVEDALDAFMIRVNEIGNNCAISYEGMGNLLNAYFNRSLSDYWMRYDFE